MRSADSRCQSPARHRRCRPRPARTGTHRGPRRPPGGGWRRCRRSAGRRPCLPARSARRRHSAPAGSCPAAQRADGCPRSGPRCCRHWCRAATRTGTPGSERCRCWNRASSRSRTRCRDRPSGDTSPPAPPRQVLAIDGQLGIQAGQGRAVGLVIGQRGPQLRAELLRGLRRRRGRRGRGRRVRATAAFSADCLAVKAVS